MKIIKLATLSILAVLLMNCTDNKNDTDLEVNAINNSDQKIDSLKVYTIIGQSMTDSLFINGIDVEKSINSVWKDIKLCNSDGSFMAISYSNGIVLCKPFGYYSNGTILYKSINIIVYEDSLVVSNSLRDL